MLELIFNRGPKKKRPKTITWIVYLCGPSVFDPLISVIACTSPLYLTELLQQFTLCVSSREPSGASSFSSVVYLCLPSDFDPVTAFTCLCPLYLTQLVLWMYLCMCPLMGLQERALFVSSLDVFHPLYLTQ